MGGWAILLLFGNGAAVAAAPYSEGVGQYVSETGSVGWNVAAETSVVSLASETGSVSYTVAAETSVRSFDSVTEGVGR